MVRWIKRIAVVVLALVALLLLVGLGYESVARVRVARAHPAPGALVDLGGRRLHVDCRGQGEPTVVFEAGLDTFGSLSWSQVHDSVAAFTRACAYDRAGIMWSDPADGPHDAEQVARDLWAALDARGEQAPFVLVAHSLGGPYALVETRDHPDRVAGLVFVDASHPDQLERFKPVLDTRQAQERMLRWVPIAARLGLVRLFFRQDPAQSPTAPVHAIELNNAFAGRSLPSLVLEGKAMEATFREAGAARDLGARPLVVLTARKPPSSTELATMGMTREQSDRIRAIWDSLHQEEAAFSTRSTRVRVPDASHYIQFDRPDLVIEAVRRVVDSVRAEKAAPPDRAGGRPTSR